MRSAPFQIALAAACLWALPEIMPAEEPADVVVPLAPLADPIGEDKPLFSEVDAVTLASYRLDDLKLARFQTAIVEMDIQARNDEALKAELDHDEAKSGGIDRFVESIEKEKPKMLAIIKAAGLSPREFVLTSYSLMMAMVYADLLKAQPATAPPPYIARENIIFVQRNEEQLAKLFESLNRD
jgi:hypothetical protein